jgi:hypothetical protein
MEIIESYKKIIFDLDKIFQNTELDTDIRIIESDFTFIDELVRLYSSNTTHKYDTKIKNIDTFKSNYLLSDKISDENKFLAALTWANTNVTLNKNFIIEQISKSNKNYPIVYNYISNGKINLTIGDIRKFPKEFIEFVLIQLQTHKTRKPFRQTNYENLDELENVHTSSLEILCVNLLMCVSCDYDNLLRCLVFNSNPRTMYFPSGNIKKFSGNLIPQITKYYQEKKLF